MKKEINRYLWAIAVNWILCIFIFLNQEFHNGYSGSQYPWYLIFPLILSFAYLIYGYIKLKKEKPKTKIKYLVYIAILISILILGSNFLWNLIY